MRRLAKFLKGMSKAGVEAWGEPVEPGDTGQLTKTVRYTVGAAKLAQSGLQLGQRGVAHVHFKIPD